jgi:hypothetical protein
MRTRLRVVSTLAAVCLATAANAQTVCATAPYDDATDSGLAGLLDRALPVLRDFPSLLGALETVGPRICLSAAPSDAFGFFEPDSNRIVISATLDPDLQLAILFHELRHVDQFARGICPNDALAMGEYARAVWALEADATTISLIVTWAMQETGDGGPWHALATLPRYAAVARGFGSDMQDGGDLISASETAFTLWYEHEDRRHDYYVSSCGAYLDRLDETHALPRYETLRDDFFDSLCVLPDGTPFSCTEPARP